MIRDVLFEGEVIKIYQSLEDVMQRAVCAVMFFAGLRRSEIWALRPEDLDWHTPKININWAWKNYDRKTRETQNTIEGEWRLSRKFYRTPYESYGEKTVNMNLYFVTRMEACRGPPGFVIISPDGSRKPR
jgi:integrase